MGATSSPASSYGGSISVAAALLATLLSLLIGAGLGALAGHFGGLPMQSSCAEPNLAMALPWIYLLLAIRAITAASHRATQTFLLVSGVIGVIGLGASGAHRSWGRAQRERTERLSRPHADLALRSGTCSGAMCFRKHCRNRDYAGRDPYSAIRHGRGHALISRTRHG